MDIETRLIRLERSARRWRTFCAVLMVAGMAWAFRGAGDAVPDVIRAHRLEIVDKDGKEAVTMFTAYGVSLLNVCDPAHPRDCVNIGAGETGASVMLNIDEANGDKTVCRVVRLQSTTEIGPRVQVSLEDKDGKQSEESSLKLK
jgi:hypothetical protein